MFQNFELETFIMILLLLIIISMIPLIELKYQSDLYDNIDDKIDLYDKIDLHDRFE